MTWVTDKTAEEIAKAFWIRRGWNWARINEMQKANLIRDVRDILEEGKQKRERV